LARVDGIRVGRNPDRMRLQYDQVHRTSSSFTRQPNDQNMPNIGLKWTEEIDRLRQTGQSDASLAGDLGVSKQLLSAVLKGAKELSPKLKASIWARVKGERELNTDRALAFLPEEKAQALLADYAELQREGQLNPHSPADVTNAVHDLLMLKASRGWSDAQLAADLGVDDTYISVMVSGRQEISFNIKRKIWARLKYDLTRDTVLWFLAGDKASAIIQADQERGQRRTARAAERHAIRADRSRRDGK
jgi:transcriptional regulator with XRE-family HTH domain